MEKKHLEAKGEWDYDFKYDILSFKVKNREYLKSIEINNIVLDLDSENFLVGVQIFEASKFLNLDKRRLRDIPNWRFDGKIEDNIAEMRLTFQVKVRNQIIEMKPIITQPLAEKENLPNSELICRQ